MLVYCSAKTSRHKKNELSYVPKRILTGMLSKAGGDLKATVGNRVTTRLLSLYLHSFPFSQSPVFPSRLCSKACQHILGIMLCRKFSKVLLSS